MSNEHADFTTLDPAAKRALLERLLRERSERSGERELSHNERGLWFHYRLAPGSCSYNIVFVGAVHTALDPHALERALDALARRHDILGSTFRESDGRIVAVAHPDATLPVRVLDATTWPSQRVQRWLDDKLEQPIDLEDGPVLDVTIIRRTPTEHLIALAMAHIVIDFWSLDLLLTELSALYDNPAAPLRAVRAHYADYVQWQARLLDSPRGEQLWDYWRQRLAGELPRVQLPGKRPRPATQTYTGARHRFEFDRSQTAALRHIAGEEGVTLQVAVLSGYLAALHRYTGQDDILVGTPMSGRGMPGSESIIGYFVNSVVLRSDLADNPSYRSLLQRTRRVVLDAIEHQDFPFALLVERLQPVRDPAFPPIFQVFFAWETSRLSVGSSAPAAGTGGLQIEPLSLAQGGAPVDLMLIVAEREHTLSAVLQYNSDLFDTDTIGRFADHLQILLSGAAAGPDEPVGSIPMLTESEIGTRASWNSTRVDDLTEHRLYDLLTAQALRTPAATAVTYGTCHLSYRELHRRAGNLALRLREAGAETGDVVGIAIDRSENSVVSALAVLAAGCAFLPVDPNHPPERLRAIHADARPPVWVTQGSLRDRLPDNVATVCLDELDDAGEAWPVSGLSADVAPDDIAYVMFTSGTTGSPKGARNTHRGICNRLLWMQQAYRLHPDDTVLHKTPANFDVSVWELFWPLLAGARVVVAAPERHRDTGYLVETIIEQDVTVAHFVPSMLRSFLADPGARRCTGLRHVITSGEALTADLRDTFFATLPGDLHNLYGPTEAAIDVTYFDCARGDDDPVVPIGKPIANTEIHIVDRYLNPVPVGVVGELYIGGVGVAKGYANRPELTSERFVHGPHVADSPAYPTGPLYRTGDRARYRHDGTIEFLGRADDQVKIRGVRIELGEIEGALAASPEVREAAVVVRNDDSETPRLAAYVVAADPHSPPDAPGLREFLRTSLPDAMIPSHFVVLGRIPTTPTGKRDHRALPEPDSTRPEMSAEYVAPQNDIERRLAELWEHTLNVDAVGIHDDFFELGGASTQIVAICTAAREIGIGLTPELVFRYRTVAGLAASVGVNADDRPTGTTSAEHSAMPSSAPVRDDLERVRPSARPGAGNTVIESLGVYLPDSVVSTTDVLGACDRPVELPLEQLTGIKSRRIAARTEFTVDLARTAAQRALSRSSHSADTIDLLVCTNISKVEGPDNRLVFEPSTSVQLRKLLGLSNALTVDISNACAGLFTGIAVADSFLTTNQVRNALVVSGEYISHVTETAQREITGFFDDRLACLTVGDAGAAVILERGASDTVGFHDLRLRTISRYADLCVGKATDQPHGGAIMRTQAVEQTAVAVQKAVPFATEMLDRYGWQPETIDHIIVHQTSDSSINDAMATINRHFGRTVATRENTVSNLEQRGNTASTTHFVAVDDMVAQGRLRPGDRVLFGITGSGQTIGGALYTFDDLPARMSAQETPPGARGSESGRSKSVRPRTEPLVRIAAVAVATPTAEETALELAVEAGRACLTESAWAPDCVDLVLYAGALRDECIVEPAMAAFVADRLEINNDPAHPFDHGSLAFDVRDGSIGFLKACQIATTAVEAGQAHTALIVAAEADPGLPSRLPSARGVQHIGSAMLVTESRQGKTGFGAFRFATHTAYLDSLTTYARPGEANRIEFHQDPAFEQACIDLIPELVSELLDSVSLKPADLAVMIAPQVSAGFLASLAHRIQADSAQMVDATGDFEADLYSSSLTVALKHCSDHKLAVPGDIGLLVAVGAGVQVGCAIYHF
ncbi:amino acid adenylation domain-containing protein [Nocardia elegans]|uniref:non-ribosomal peptide synthetase n=1 Tax=Nocardia elegans TaxID=300029 RepID=UPI0018959593|nr:non-ribosomal peptide synthetase [Nocardia elegans]MBF6245648.1 amino acid adenylation domain-containing protein [Nocardia elegans]